MFRGGSVYLELICGKADLEEAGSGEDGLLSCGIHLAREGYGA